SRASLLTGMRPDSVKVWDLRVHFRETVPDVVTLPQHFKNNGYHTAGIGKIYHTVGGHMEDPISWSVPKMKPKGRFWIWPDEVRAEHKKFRDRLRAEGKSQSQVDRIRATATVCEEVPDNARYDGAQTDVAIEKLREIKDYSNPFFLAVGYIRPHLPFVPPKKYWDMYDRDSIPLADNDFLPKESPAVAMNTMYELRDYMDFLNTSSPAKGALTKEQQKLLKHGYYASVSFIDAQVARLMDELDRLGLRDNTIVILWGDHGWKLGEHRSWCKQTNYEDDTRVPLIISAPGCQARGRTCNALVELIDIYPTLCDLSSLPISEQLEGRSFKPLLNDPALSWKQGAFSQFLRRYKGTQYMGHSIRTNRYRFVEWRNCQTGKVFASELYDHQSDPYENINIADKNENKKLVYELSKQLRKTCPVLPSRVTLPKVCSFKSEIPTSLQIINKLAEPVDIYWLDYYGGRQKRGFLKSKQKVRQETFVGHYFVAVSKSGEKRFLLNSKDFQNQPAILK
ncbi:MAG: sulfatase-like hydrolase/transferase, partial [Planctomycetota bacterium]